MSSDCRSARSDPREARSKPIEVRWRRVREEIWGIAAINLLLLVRNRSRRLPRQVTAEVFLLGGYLPNAARCLADFSGEGPFGWDIGGYFVLGTCIGYLLRAVFLLWRPKDDGARPTAPADARSHFPSAEVSRLGGSRTVSYPSSTITIMSAPLARFLQHPAICPGKIEA